MKDLRHIYNQIYAIHRGAQGKVSYTFSPEAEKLFNDHTSSTVAAANAVFNGESQEFIDSKDEKHIIRLSCIIHVLKEAFSNALETNELSGASAARTSTEGASAAPTFVISLSSMRGAIAVTKYFAEQRNILSKVTITTNFKSIVCIKKKDSLSPISYATLIHHSTLTPLSLMALLFCSLLFCFQKLLVFE